jgi:hypothetical protein
VFLTFFGLGKIGAVEVRALTEVEAFEECAARAMGYPNAAALKMAVVPDAAQRNSLKIPSTAGLFLPHASCRNASKDTRFAMRHCGPGVQELTQGAHDASITARC